MVLLLETLSEKLARLLEELQKAYDAWLGASGHPDEFENIGMPPVDISGCQESAKDQWFAYQAAKVRLVEAYAGLSN